MKCHSFDVIFIGIFLNINSKLAVPKETNYLFINRTINRRCVIHFTIFNEHIPDFSDNCIFVIYFSF
jgi:hypothetical protein